MHTPEAVAHTPEARTRPSAAAQPAYSAGVSHGAGTVGERRRWAFLPMFVLGSFAVHGVAYAALHGVDIGRTLRDAQVVEVELAVVAEPAAPEPIAPEPVAVPEVVAPVAPPLVTRAMLKPSRPEAAPTKAEAEAPVPSAEPPPPLAILGATADDGIVVAGQVGTGGSTGPGSLTGSATGVIGGQGGAPGAVHDASIDLRKLTSEWASRVSLAIGTRAVHAYPRSALRARVEGTVLLKVRVGIAGEIEAVDVLRSSGFPQLDEAALAAARELGAVPAPPAALHRYLRPFPVPVNYVIRG